MRLFYDADSVITNIQSIQAAILGAFEHLGEIETGLSHLEAAGMYPAVPTEQWQRRNGNGEYLYMIFRKGKNGEYQGPDGKRKVYIGCKAEAIGEARRLAANRRKYERLTAQRNEVIRWINGVAGSLKSCDTIHPYADLQGIQTIFLHSLTGDELIHIL